VYPRRVAQLCSFYELANELKKIQRTYPLKTTSGRLAHQSSASIGALTSESPGAALHRALHGPMQDRSEAHQHDADVKRRVTDDVHEALIANRSQQTERLSSDDQQNAREDQEPRSRARQSDARCRRSASYSFTTKPSAASGGTKYFVIASNSSSVVGCEPSGRSSLRRRNRRLHTSSEALR